ncbi:MAG: hypothetical protein L3J45_08125 [Flavobacteriaceae bacterium]|nr:hypothetical protein [Flavobacteriaceae bacterium]
MKKKQIYNQLFLLIIPLFFLTSCNYFFPKQGSPNTPTIDTVIDFTSVDAYPLFPECQNIPARDKQKVCFKIKMAEHINRILKQHPLETKTADTDTLLVTLKVLQTGKIHFIKVTSKSHNKNYEKLLSALLKKSESKLPILKPAIKRGMPVTTQFELPVIIKN